MAIKECKIKKECKITISGNTASIDKEIYLYKNDMNIKCLFDIVNSDYVYTKDSALDNVINASKASYAQVKFKKDDIEIDFDVQETSDGKAIIYITEELTDEDTELGDYTIQIRLFDESKTSVITLPPVNNCIHIMRPIFEKVDGSTNVVDEAAVDEAIVTYAEPVASTNEDGTFAKKTWVPKEKITTAELNRMEEGISDVSSQCKENQINLIEDDTSMEGISDSVHDTLETNDKTIIGAINEVNDKSKDIANLTKNKYFVGKNYPYKSITAAIDKWKQDNTPIAEIHIAEGEYNDIISINPGKSISFIGAGKILTTWRTTSGHYKDAPLTARGGNIIVKNMTIIADHSDAGDSYDYIGNPDGTGTGKYQNAYALHFDSGNGGNYFVKNCDLISYQDAGLGCGTVENTTIRVEDTNIFSYTDSNTTHPNASGSLNHGGLLYHSYDDKGTPTTNENLELVNVNIYSKNSPYPFIYKNYSTDGSNKNLFCKNVCVSGDNCTGLFLTSSKNGSSKPYYNLNSQSFGNNVPEINASKLGENIGIDDRGYAKFIEDANNINKCGYYYSSTNIPTGAGYWFINHIQFEKYAYQEAKSLGNTPMYTRQKVKDIWSDWDEVRITKSAIETLVQHMINVSSDGRATEITDIDNLRKCGYYVVPKTVAGLPEAKYYVMHSIVANSAGAVQQIWDLKTGTSYKRVCNNNVWTSWVQV